MTGLDRDTGHLAFTQKQTRALGLPCVFREGDALALPFPEKSFDLCYSYTVVEHLPRAPFLAEQRRVLRPGGRCAVLSVRSRLGIARPNGADAEERDLLERAWRGTERLPDARPLGAYELADERELPRALEEAGFHSVRAAVLSVMDYAPDSADTPPERAVEQIETDRLHAHMSARKARGMCPDGLTPAEDARLHALIDARFDARLARFRAGEREWDLSSSTVFAVSGLR